MTDTIPEDVLRVLSAVDISGNEVIILGHLDHKLYLAVNKVLDRIGGKWNKYNLSVDKVTNCCDVLK